MKDEAKDLESANKDLVVVKESETLPATLDEAQPAEKEPTLRELQQQINGLQAALMQVLGQGQALPGQVQPPRESAVDKAIREFEKPYSPEEIKEAERWVVRQMGGRLRVEKGPGGKGRKGPEIIFERYVVDQSHRDRGITTLPDGFTITHSGPVYVIARYYLPIILDKTSYETEEHKLFAIYRDSAKRGEEAGTGPLHPELKYLFTSPDGNLKPLRPRETRSQRRREERN